MNEQERNDLWSVERRNDVLKRLTERQEEREALWDTISVLDPDLQPLEYYAALGSATLDDLLWLNARIERHADLNRMLDSSEGEDEAQDAS